MRQGGWSGRGTDESPVRELTLPAFFLSKYEVAQGQWMRFTGGNPSYYEPHNYPRHWDRTGSAADLLHPVQQVTWATCREICRAPGAADFTIGLRPARTLAP